MPRPVTRSEDLRWETVIRDHSTRPPAPRRTVLHIRSVVGAGGGADKTTLKSPAYLRDSPYRAAAVYLRADGDGGFAEIRARARHWRCPLFEVSDCGAFDLCVAARLFALARRLRAQVWHAHEYKSNVLGVIVGRLLGLKLVSTVHGWVERSPKLDLFYRLDYWALRRFDRVVAVSPDLYEFCLTKGIDRGRLRLIPNAIEAAQYRRRRSPLAARQAGDLPGSAGRAAERLVIGALARLSPEKGLAFLIDAVAQLVAGGADVELWIAGDGREREALEAQAARSGAGNRVIFLGHVSDPVALYECLDIFCLPSLREGLPNTLLEALAMEVPVVATAVGGIPAVLHDGEDCRLVAPGSAAPLTAVLSELIADAGLRMRLARAGRELVEREFDFAARMAKMIAVYDELFAPSPGDAAGSRE